jgi:membrane protease subunit HflC
VRVKRVDFPQSTVESIYNRMRTEREREAREHRAQGTEMSDRIKSEADRQQRVILADAYRQAETLRGEGDAQVALIARKAFGQDAEFYSFYRSLQAYRNSFNRSDDVLVLKSDSEFLKYMRKPGK